MPAHDWTRVDSGVFHSFHTSLIGELTEAVNDRLPRNYYALNEQFGSGVVADVMTLHRPDADSDGATDASEGLTAVLTSPPKVELTMRAEREHYLRTQRSLVIRHRRGDRIVAMVEVLSPGNKSSQHALETFVEKAWSALDHGIHLLLIDLFPPGPRDPNGIHGAIWEGDLEEPYLQPTDKPLTLVAYSSGEVRTAYVQPFQVGEALVEMPLFLMSDSYINVLLEQCYQAAYRGIPRIYREVLER